MRRTRHRREKNCVENLLPWLHVKSIPGIGNHLFKRLIDRFGTPEAVLQASAAELLTVDGITPRTVSALRSRKAPDGAAEEIEEAQRRGFRLIPLTHADYPSLLREIPDPPPFLYVSVDLSLCERPIAVVGSRNATPYGVAMAQQLSGDLASLGFTVASGMAVGIDAAAHEGALSAHGRTAAVLGSGLANIYPPQHRRLFERISAGGAVLSEFPLAAEPEAHHFPVRNRVISGMSLGTVVVEASRNSGSLITARLAAEQNREVFAVPGSIQSFKSMGTHTLIKQGAKLVENAQDIVSELGHFLADRAPESGRPPVEKEHSLTEEEKEVCRALGPYPLHIDELVRKLAMDAGRLSGILLQLELKGIVTQQAGKLFSAADGRDV
jgi:DNA processing protein